MCVATYRPPAKDEKEFGGSYGKFLTAVWQHLNQ